MAFAIVDAATWASWRCRRWWRSPPADAEDPFPAFTGGVITASFEIEVGRRGRCRTACG